jgi:hypothetical protein
MSIKNPTIAKRHQAFPKRGAAKKVINHPSLTLGSIECSQVIGFSKYNPMGSDRNKSITK